MGCWLVCCLMKFGPIRILFLVGRQAMQDWPARQNWGKCVLNAKEGRICSEAQSDLLINWQSGFGSWSLVFTSCGWLIVFVIVYTLQVTYPTMVVIKCKERTTPSCLLRFTSLLYTAASGKHLRSDLCKNHAFLYITWNMYTKTSSDICETFCVKCADTLGTWRPCNLWTVRGPRRWNQ